MSKYFNQDLISDAAYQTRDMVSSEERIAVASKIIRDALAIGNVEGILSHGYYKGVGVNVDPKWSTEEKLKHAGLDWMTEASSFEYGNNRQFTAEKKNIVYRQDTGQIFGLAGEHWKPYQNSEVLRSFEQFCEEANLKIERLGALKGGELIFATAVIPSSWCVLGESSDAIAARLLLLNSHVCGTGLTAKLNTIRLVCANGMTDKLSISKTVINHVREFSRAKVNEVLHQAQFSFESYGDRCDKLAQIEINNKDAQNFLVETLGKKDQFGNLERFEEQNRLVKHSYYTYINRCGLGGDLGTACGTAWGLLNTVTQQLSHNSRSYGEKHMHSMWDGAKAFQGNKVMSSLEYEFLNRGKRKSTQTVHQSVRN